MATIRTLVLLAFPLMALIACTDQAAGSTGGSEESTTSGATSDGVSSDASDSESSDGGSSESSTNGSGDGDPGDGDPGDGDPGDGDPGDPLAQLEPCEWTAEPATPCTPTFAPVPPPAPIMGQQGNYWPILGVIARSDSVEVIWRRSFYDSEDEHLGNHIHHLSNDQGMWQSELVLADACPSCTEAGPLWILGSTNATRVAPYLRRVGAQWQIPPSEPPYDNPMLAAIGPDDRSYLVGSVGNYHLLVWHETEEGCHVPVWRLQSGPAAQCRRSWPRGAAVDGDGVLHLTGSEQLADQEWQIVHWKLGIDEVERREVGPVPNGLHYLERPLWIDESDAFHTCYPPAPNQGITTYAHGHDANDLVELHLDDPNQLPNIGMLAQTHCKLALAPDGTAWLTWVSFPPPGTESTDPFRVASVLDGVVTYEVIDVGAAEGSAAISVDSSSRPWLVYHRWNGADQGIRVAHRENDTWIVEQVNVP